MTNKISTTRDSRKIWAIIILGIVWLLMFEKFPQWLYNVIIYLEYLTLLVMTVYIIVSYSTEYNDYELYTYIPMLMVLFSLVNASYHNKILSIASTFVSVIFILWFTRKTIHEKSKSVCKNIRNGWGFCVSIVVFISAIAKYMEQIFSYHLPDHCYALFYSSVLILAAIQFCVEWMEHKLDTE